MHLQVGQIVRGSRTLHDTFKVLAPKGLVLKFNGVPHEPILTYKNNKYMYIAEPYETEPMDGAWMCLKDSSWEFTVMKSPISKITRTKVLYDN